MRRRGKLGTDTRGSGHCGDTQSPACSSFRHHGTSSTWIVKCSSQSPVRASEHVDRPLWLVAPESLRVPRWQRKLAVQGCCEWARHDSNARPTDYESHRGCARAHSRASESRKSRGKGDAVSSSGAPESIVAR